MRKFKIPAVPPTTNKSIRFPNDVIEQVEAAIQGKDCTFSMLPDFPDAASASNRAEEALAWAATKKLLNGTVIDGTVFLRPGDSATRAQIAVMITRYLEKFPTE